MASTFVRTSRQAPTTTAPTSAVHPAHRGRGIGRRIYEGAQGAGAALRSARHRGRRLLHRLYAAVRTQLSVPEYVAQVVAGRRSDPTLSSARPGLPGARSLPDYIADSASDGCGADRLGALTRTVLHIHVSSRSL